MIAAVATAADVSYTTARDMAASITGYDGTEGLNFRQAQQVLNNLGIAATWNEQDSHWSGLPARAIIAVEESDREPHAVFYDRNEKGEETLYDLNNDGPVRRDVTKYRLTSGDDGEYLDLT